jgi:hypothetical protein
VGGPACADERRARALISGELYLAANPLLFDLSQEDSIARVLR